MKKYAKILVSLLLIVCVAGVTTTFTSCKSHKTATMYPQKKYKSSKPIKDNYTIRGTNKKNGSTYHSY